MILQRTFSLVRNQPAVEMNSSFHLNKIDEDNEILLDDLGAEHESSDEEEDDEDEFFAFDKRRHESGPQKLS